VDDEGVFDVFLNHPMPPSILLNILQNIIIPTHHANTSPSTLIARLDDPKVLITLKTVLWLLLF